MRAFLISAIALSANAMADIPFHGSLAAFAEEGGGPVTRGPGVYSTGFEAAEGFNPGPIEPQAGWAASGVNLPWASVDTVNPNAGSQHLRLGVDTSVAAGTTRVSLGPNLGVVAPGPSISSADINISAAGGAAYTLIGQAPSQAFITFRVQFFANDGGSGAGVPVIGVLDDPDGAGPLALAFYLADTDPGTAGTQGWTAGAYKNLTVENNGANLLYYYDGVLVYTGAIYAGTAVEQIGALSDNRQLQDVGDVDNFSVTVPEPSALALLALGGLAALRRR